MGRAGLLLAFMNHCAGVEDERHALMGQEVAKLPSVNIFDDPGVWVCLDEGCNSNCHGNVWSINAEEKLRKAAAHWKTQFTKVKEQADQVKSEELGRLFNKLPELDKTHRQEIQRSLNRVVNKLLHPPLESLRDEAQAGAPHGLLDALKRLFQIKD